jgi:hypothetical protein
MRRNQCANYSIKKIIGTDHFYTVFWFTVHSVGCADEGIAARQCAKLSFTQDLPAALVVVADVPCTGFKHGAFDRVEMGGR